MPTRDAVFSARRFDPGHVNLDSARSPSVSAMLMAPNAQWVARRSAHALSRVVLGPCVGVQDVAGRTSNHYWKRDLKDRQAAPTLITFEFETYFP